MATSKRRPRAESAGRGRRAALNGLALIAVLAAAWGAVNTPVFHANVVRISGASRLSRANVLRAADVGPATNVVRLSTASVAARLEADPWIAHAEVTKELPDTISIVIRERRPAAALQVRGRWAVVSGDAVVLAISPKRPHLPRIVPAGRSLVVAAVGDRLESVGSLSRVLSRMPRRIGVVSARFVIPGEAELTLASGTLVRYGDPTGWRQKNAAIQSLLTWAWAQGRAAEALDVRVPEAPALRLSATPAPA